MQQIALLSGAAEESFEGLLLDRTQDQLAAPRGLLVAIVASGAFWWLVVAAAGWLR
jgi:hypothetical protein